MWVKIFFVTVFLNSSLIKSLIKFDTTFDQGDTDCAEENSATQRVFGKFSVFRQTLRVLEFRQFGKSNFFRKFDISAQSVIQSGGI